MLVLGKGHCLASTLPVQTTVRARGAPLPWLEVTLKPVPHTRNAVSGHSSEGRTTPNSLPDVLSTTGYHHLGLCLSFEGMIQKTGVTLPKKPQGSLYPMAQPPHWMCIHISGGHRGHKATDTFWYPQHLGFMFALASAEPLLKYFQGDVLSQQLGMEMPLLRGEYHQKHLVLGRCSTGRVQSQASLVGKE